ncbi:MAG TPA: hypothetical protein VJC18_01320, partial [bacterium]|nr:hypothetical protein [bacterium]
TGTYQFIKDEWADVEDTKAALEMYRTALGQIGWASDNGAIDQCLANFDAMAVAAEEIAQDNMDQYTDAIDSAINAVKNDWIAYFEIGTWLFDGITGDHWKYGVVGALDALKGATTVDEAYLALQTHFATVNAAWDGDILASVIVHLKQTESGKALLKQFKAMDGFKTWAAGIINGEKDKPYHADGALNFLYS